MVPRPSQHLDSSPHSQAELGLRPFRPERRDCGATESKFMTQSSSSSTRTRRSLTSGAALLAAIVVAALSGGNPSASTPQQVGAWASFGTIADSRTGAAAVALPDGRTLILGGVVADGTPTDSVIAVDPVSKSVSQAGQMFAARVGHTATLRGSRSRDEASGGSCPDIRAGLRRRTGARSG